MIFSMPGAMGEGVGSLLLARDVGRQGSVAGTKKENARREKIALLPGALKSRYNKFTVVAAVVAVAAANLFSQDLPL